MEGVESMQDEGVFCRAYLRTMDPERAAAEAGRRDGYKLLGKEPIKERLERMRTDAASQLRREDAIRRLAQLAFGRANDAVYLALHPELADPERLDLSAVQELKVTEKGVELKLVDRVRALDTLCGLLEDDGGGLDDLRKTLEQAAEVWHEAD